MILKQIITKGLITTILCSCINCTSYVEKYKQDAYSKSKFKEILKETKLVSDKNLNSKYYKYLEKINFTNEADYRSNQESFENEYTKNHGLLEASSGILVDTDKMEIIYAQNALADRAPASTTKLLTAITALEFLDLDTPLKVGCERDFIARDSSVCGIKKGDMVTVNDLLHGLLIKSGNDAAYTLACYAGMYIQNNTFIPFNENKFDGKYALPSTYDYSEKDAIKYISTFINFMNINARIMGCETANFSTPDGYDDEHQRVTAIDLAKICVCAKQNKTISEICNTTSYYCETLDKTWISTNELMNKETEYYNPNVDGLKTGTTDDAGMCFVSSADNNNAHLVSVILGGDTESRWSETNKLLNVGFAR